MTTLAKFNEQHEKLPIFGFEINILRKFLKMEVIDQDDL